MRHISIDENVTGEKYRRLMEYCFAHSDSAMTTFTLPFPYPDPEKQRRVDASLRNVREMLRPYLLDSYNDSERTPEHPEFSWPGTIWYTESFSPPKPDAPITYADTYELSDFVKDFILSIDGIFNWTPWGNENPNDLAFFDKGDDWFYITAHEYICGMTDRFGDLLPLVQELGIAHHVFYR